MTHVVIDGCIRCKYMDCCAVCPVDCFYEGANMLVIDPDECIDCQLCVPECPVDAIYADVDLPAGQEIFLEVNRKYAPLWPVITRVGTPPADAAEWDDVDNKYPEHFDPKPGSGGGY